MTTIENTGLSAPRGAGIMRAAVMLALFAVLALLADRVAAQQPQQQPDDLDVTMQIIVDPDAKRPDEVVRRIPLPTRKPADSTPTGQTGPPGKQDKQEGGKQEGAGSGNDRDKEARETREHGRENSEAAKERAREAAEQREAARRAEAEERRRRERGPPDDRPDPPNRPPRN